MAMLTGAQKLPRSPSSREHGLETAYKRALPLLHSQTSSLFCINVINSGAQKFDGSNKPTSQLASSPTSAPSPFWIIQGEIIDGEWSDMAASDAADTPNSASHVNPPQTLSPSSLIHPLEELDDNKIMQTIESYGVLEGLMYPIVDTANVMRMAKCFMDARAGYSNQRPPEFQTLELCRSDLAILKLVLATGLLTEGDMHNAMALRLFQSVHSEVESMLWSDTVDLKDLVSMTLVVTAPSTEIQPLRRLTRVLPEHFLSTSRNMASRMALPGQRHANHSRARVESGDCAHALLPRRTDSFLGHQHHLDDLRS
jgi:hypothetical protein